MLSRAVSAFSHLPRHSPASSLLFTRAFSTAAPKNPVRVSFENNVFQLRFTDPASSSTRVFLLRPSDDTTSISQQIAEEFDYAPTAVSLQRPNGEVVDKGTVMDLVQGDFVVKINNDTLHCDAPDYVGGAYGVDEDIGDVNLREIVQKAAFSRLRAELEQIESAKLSVADYLRLCKAHGIPEREARTLLRDLHRIGFLLHFENAQDPDVRESIFLHPDEVAEAMFARLGLRGPKEVHQTKAGQVMHLQLRALEKELSEKRRVDQLVNAHAKRWAESVKWGTLLALSGGTGFYYWLVFEELSWDIMEPITFFTGVGVGLIGYGWWLVTSEEFEYSSLYDYTFRKRRNTELRKYYSTQNDASLTDSQGVTHKSFSERFDAELAHLENQRMEYQEELERLPVNQYDPALVSALLGKDIWKPQEAAATPPQ